MPRSRGQRDDLGQRAVQVLLDVVAERLERRDVDDFRAVRAACPRRACRTRRSMQRGTPRASCPTRSAPRSACCARPGCAASPWPAVRSAYANRWMNQSRTSGCAHSRPVGALMVSLIGVWVNLIHNTFRGTRRNPVEPLGTAYDLFVSDRETLELDILIVGGGPAGMAAALRLAQLQKDRGGEPLAIAVLDKAREPGAHALSGAVLDPSTLKDLIPDFEAKGAPLASPVHHDDVYFLTERRKLRFPITPPPLETTATTSSRSTRWSSGWRGRSKPRAASTSSSGFAASEVLYDRATVHRRTHRRSRPRQARRPQTHVRARRRHPREDNHLLRRRARQPDQDPDQDAAAG